MGKQEYYEQKLCDADTLDKVRNVWNELKEDKQTLESAVSVRHSIESGYTLESEILSTFVLNYNKDVDIDVYLKLLTSIFSKPNIARKVNFMNQKTFLTTASSNHLLLLNEKQKTFLVMEAANNIEKHNKGIFDLRYQILRNISFTDDEKKELVYELYNDVEYDEVLSQWEWSILHDKNYNQNIQNIYECTYSDLTELNDASKEDIECLFSKIEFCKKMHSIRAKSTEKRLIKSRKNYKQK